MCKNDEAGHILASSSLTDDEKLLGIFELYKEDIRKQNVNLYYALLAWRDTHNLVDNPWRRKYSPIKEEE